MKTGIYMIRNKINDKKYIGQAVDIDTRWATHIRELNDNNHNNRYLQNSWNKYGEDNFEFTIICLCEEEELDEFEIDMIAHFDTYNNGYNLTLGGDGVRGYRYTDEQRARRSETLKGKPKSEKTKAKVSEAMKKVVYCVTNNTIYASTVEAEEELLGKYTGGTVSYACKGKYGSGNGHIYKKLGLEFWYLDEYEEKFGKVAM